MNEEKISQHIYSSEQDIKSMHRRLDDLEKLVETIHIIATETKAMRESMNNLDERISNVEKRPEKRYEAVITAAITSIVGIIIGFLLKGGI